MEININSLPTDVSGLIFENLEKAEDRANLAMANTQTEHVYSQAVKNQRIPDHRPLVEKIKELARERPSIESFRTKSRCYQVVAGTSLSGGISGIVLFFVSIMQCCPMSVTTTEILVYTGLGLGCGCPLCGLVSAGIFWKACTVGDDSSHEATALIGKNEKDMEACKKKLEELQVPKTIAMEYEPSYQNSNQ